MLLIAIEVCVSCAPIFKKQVSPETYSTNVEEMLEYVRNNIPNTIVNLSKYRFQKKKVRYFS